MFAVINAVLFHPNVWNLVCTLSNMDTSEKP